MAARNSRNVKKEVAKPIVLKFVCIDPDKNSATGETALGAFEKYKSDIGSYDIECLDFFELGAKFKGREAVTLIPAEAQ